MNFIITRLLLFTEHTHYFSWLPLSINQSGNLLPLFKQWSSYYPFRWKEYNFQLVYEKLLLTHEYLQTFIFPDLSSYFHHKTSSLLSVLSHTFASCSILINLIILQLRLYVTKRRKIRRGNKSCLRSLHNLNERLKKNVHRIRPHINYKYQIL